MSQGALVTEVKPEQPRTKVELAGGRAEELPDNSSGGCRNGWVGVHFVSLRALRAELQDQIPLLAGLGNGSPVMVEWDQ